MQSRLARPIQSSGSRAAGTGSAEGNCGAVGAAPGVPVTFQAVYCW
jgi:hypothetical protein